MSSSLAEAAGLAFCVFAGCGFIGPANAANAFDTVSEAASTQTTSEFTQSRLFVAAELEQESEQPVETKESEEGRQRFRMEAKRLRDQAEQLDAEEKLRDAVKIGKQLLKIGRQLSKPLDRDATSDLEWLADCYERLEMFAVAREARAEILQNRIQQCGKDSWQVTDARLALENTALRESLSAEERAKLREADAALAKVLSLHSRGTYALALPIAEGVLADRKSILGPSHRDVATSTHWLARECKYAGHYARAKPLLQQALDLRKRILGERHPDYANSLNELAELNQWMGDNGLAETQYQGALEIRSRAVGTKHPDYAGSLNGLASLYGSWGAFARAEPLFQQALEIRKQALGEKHPEYAQTINGMAELYQSMGDNGRAEPLCRQAMEIRRESLGETHPDYAISLNNLAELYRSTGEYTRAEPLYRNALAIKKKALGEEHPSYSTSLNNLAALYQWKGDFVRAEPLYSQSLEIKRKVLGESHPEYATNLNNLAILNQSMGDYARAEPLSRAASQIWKRTLGEAHPYYATSLNNLAFLYCLMHDYKQAELLYRQALQIKAKAIGEKHPDYANTLSNLAALYQATGDYAQAGPLYRQALEIRKQSQGEMHPDYAASLVKLASMYLRLGDPMKAEGLYLQAREIQRAVLGEMHPEYAQTLNELGRLYQSMSDFARADTHYCQSLSISRRNLELSAAVQSQRQQMAMAERLRSQLDNYLALATAAPACQESAYKQLLAWKGAVLLRQQAMRAARANPQSEKIFGELERVTAQLARRSFMTPHLGQQETWRREIIELSDQKERLERQLSAESSAYRQARSEVTLDDVRRALPTDAVLIDILESYADFTSAQRLDGSGVGEGHAKRVLEQRYLAFLVSKTRPVQLVVLGSPKEVEPQIEVWRSDFGRSPQACAAGLWLRDHVWEPLERSLDGAKLVLISPDGSLGNLPFAALPSKQSDSYLLEEPDRMIAFVPTAAALTLLAGGVDSKQPEKNLLIVGGVDYNRRNVKDLLAANTSAMPKKFGRAPHMDERTIFDPLPATEGELATIKLKYEAQGFDAAALTTLQKNSATEEAFRRLAPQHKYLHLATHGFFAAPRFKSALERSTLDVSRVGPEAIHSEQSIAGYNPSLLSGIVLAGANDPADEGEDEILTAEEVQTLDLRGNQLVVLSACETSLGKTAGGEGLLGLQRAFQVAGTRSVIASMWQVDDAATRDLMERFYENLWNKNMGKLEALKEAQLWMLKERGPRGLTTIKGGSEQESVNSNRLPPYYWGAWVLSGDWR